MTQFDDSSKPSSDLTLPGVLRVILWGYLYFSLGFLANLVFLSTLFIYPFAPGLAYEVNSRTAFGVWWIMQKVWEDKKGAVITFSGDGVPDDENAIVLGAPASFVAFGGPCADLRFAANHVSYADFYLIVRRDCLHPHVAVLMPFALLAHRTLSRFARACFRTAAGSRNSSSSGNSPSSVSACGYVARPSLRPLPSP